MTAAATSADTGSKAPIGIVIPAYGHPRFLGEAIQSACTQETDRPIHVVVVDDGCRFQETADLVAGLCETYAGKLHYLRHKNTRLPGARNKGVRFLLALCPDMDAIYFLDADNRIAPYAIEAFRRALGDDPAIGWAYPDIAFFGLSWGREGFDTRETAPDYSVLKHLCGNISEAGSLVRADVFRAHVYYDESMRSGFEDWDFWMSALEAGYRGVRVKDAGFLYRRRAESMLADSRREEDQLLARMRQKHKALFDPGHIMRLIQDEAPTFAILPAGDGTVQLTADPVADAACLSLDAFAARLLACRKSPREHFFPNRILLVAPELWAWLQAEAKPFLRWLFWQLLRDRRPLVAYRFGEGQFPDVTGGMAGPAHLLVMDRDLFEDHVWGDSRDTVALMAEAPGMTVRLPLAGTGDIPALDAAAALAPIYDRLDPSISWLRHSDRRYAGPDARRLVDDFMAPLLAAEPEVFPPVPWVRGADERWFAFVATPADLKAGTFEPYLDWARVKGYRTLLLVERDRAHAGFALPASAWTGLADMVMPVVLEGGARVSRYYLGRKVQSSMGQSGQLEMETLAFHFDHLMASEHAVSLEAFGAARHRGVRTALYLSPAFFASGVGRPDDFGRLLAYEHAIDAIVADEGGALAPVLSAQGIPGEKLVPAARFFPRFAPAGRKRASAPVLAQPLGWAPPGGYAFIVTYGRSGSTLLQTLLQSFDGYCIRGENENALWEIFQAVRRLSSVRQRFDVRQSVPPHGPWYGADEIDIEAYAARLVDAFVAEVLRPPADTRVAGFKEIRYGELEAGDLVAFLDFIRTRFEPVKIIFNTRDWQGVSKSGWWRGMDTDEVRAVVERSDKVFADYAARHADRCCVVRYDAYVASPEALRPVFDLLGEDYDEGLVARLLGNRLSH
ncbi:MAG: glycosyltransferase [Alphaproteobacteria bacterium]|nr:MAG: glycosyltransferase [Alphaproteobacteria bacterium]